MSPMPGRNASTSPSNAAQHVPHRGGHRCRQVARGGQVAPGMLHGDGEQAAGALDHRARPSGRTAAHRRAVARHRQQPQLRPQLPLQVQAQAPVPGRRSSARSCTSSRITRPTPSSPGSDSEAAHQQPFRHHLDPRGRRHGRVEPGAEADRARPQRSPSSAMPSGSRPRVPPAGVVRASRYGPAARPSRCSGASVVLPAPGGATSTALPCRQRGTPAPAVHVLPPAAAGSSRRRRGIIDAATQSFA